MWIGGNVIPATAYQESPVWIPSGSPPPFIPTDIAGCVMWLDASQLPLSNGDPVSSWTDESGNGNNGTASGLERPTFVNPSINGLPSLLFAASKISFVDFSALTSATLFLVYKNTFDGNGNSIYMLSQSSNDVKSYVPYSGDGKVYDSFFTNTRKDALGSGTALASGWNIYDVHSASGYWECFVNGASQFSTASNTVSAPSSATLGYDGSGFSTGQSIAEVILYNSALSSTPSSQVRSYLQAKYAL